MKHQLRSRPVSGTVYAKFDALADRAGTDGCFGTNFCPYVPLSVTFSGVAKSVDFGGTANQIGFDNITFGSATAGSGTPEPAAWALMIVGFGMVGVAARRRKVAVAA